MDLSATINNDESNNSDIYSPRTFLLQDVPQEPMFSEPPEQRLDEQSLLNTDLIASPTASETTSLPKDNNQYQFYYPQPVCSLPPVDTTMTNSITADSSHGSAVSLNYPSTSASGVAKIEANGKKEKKSKGDGCRCQQSKCLKLYCACFRDSQLCSESCRCASCENTTAESGANGKIAKARQEIQLKKPNAFREKTCKCKKSRCLLKYCACYCAGKKCGDDCKCEDCQNPNGVRLSSGVNAHFDFG